MNNTLQSATFAAFTLCAALAAPAALADAGSSCHFHGNKPAIEATIGNCANQRKAQLVKGGKLDAAWQAINTDKIEAVDGKKGKEWKVTFKDAAAKDKAKETLYMFFTLPGNFIAANFTGH